MEHPQKLSNYPAFFYVSTGAIISHLMSITAHKSHKKCCFRPSSSSQVDRQPMSRSQSLSSTMIDYFYRERQVQLIQMAYSEGSTAGYAGQKEDFECRWVDIEVDSPEQALLVDLVDRDAVDFACMSAAADEHKLAPSDSYQIDNQNDEEVYSEDRGHSVDQRCQVA